MQYNDVTFYVIDFFFLGGVGGGGRGGVCPVAKHVKNIEMYHVEVLVLRTLPLAHN